MFKRDSFTWLNYLMLSIFGYVLLALSPVMNLLSAELGYSKTISGLHMSLYALGAIASGFTVAPLIARWGRHRVLWVSSFLTIAATLGLSASGNVVASLLSVLGLGFMASHLGAVVQAALADHHGENKAIAILESNLAASLSQALPPLLIGILVANSLDWRFAFYFIGTIVLGAWALGRKIPFEAQNAHHSENTGKAKLPLSYWKAWLLVVFLVSAEWAINFWGISYLTYRSGLSPDQATLWFGLYTLTYIGGRVIVSYLLRFHKPDRILLGILVYMLAVFPLFWLADSPVFSVLGLALLGFGASNLYPLGLTLALDSAGPLSDLGSGRLLFAVGGGILVSPLLLGWLGDTIPLFWAYTVEPIFLIAAVFAWMVWKRSTKTLKVTV